jgi:hypothetical protein
MVNGSLPGGYDETRIVLLPVDPYVVHVYWELSESDKRRVKLLVEDEPLPLKAVLRFHDVTELPVGGFHAAGSFDVEIKIESCNWYVRLLSPEKSYIVDLGLRGKGGRFHRIGQSNRAGTPRAWPCEEAGEHLMRVVEWRGGVHVDHLAERQLVGDATPMLQPARGPQARPVTEGHREVVGLPGVGVRTAVPERVPETKPSHRPAEAVEEPLFRTEEESGTGKPAQAPSHRGQREASRPPQRARPDDARDGSRTKPGETYERKERKSIARGEDVARSGPPPGGQQGSTDIDLSLWCEDQFVSGLSSQQVTGAGKEDNQD